MKKYLYLLLILTFVLSGCGSSNKQEVEKFIQDAFKARADAVFLYKDKEQLMQHYSAKALEQSSEYLNWSPNGQWDNVKNLKYSKQLRINELKVDGKQASAVVLETVVVTWDYIDPSKVVGTAFTKEDAWSNKKHLIKLTLTSEGNWIIDEDIITK